MPVISIPPIAGSPSRTPSNINRTNPVSPTKNNNTTPTVMRSALPSSVIINSPVKLSTSPKTPTNTSNNITPTSTKAQISYNSGKGSTTIKDTTTGAQIAFAGISANDLINYNNNKAVGLAKSGKSYSGVNYNYLLQGYADTYANGKTAPIVKTNMETGITPVVNFEFSKKSPTLSGLSNRAISGNMKILNSSLITPSSLNKSVINKNQITTGVNVETIGKNVDNWSQIGSTIKGATDYVESLTSDISNPVGFAAGMAAELILPLDLIRTTQKIMDGRMGEMTPVDWVYTAADLLSLVPIAGLAAKGIKAGVKTATKIGSVLLTTGGFGAEIIEGLNEEVVTDDITSPNMIKTDGDTQNIVSQKIDDMNGNYKSSTEKINTSSDNNGLYDIINSLLGTPDSEISESSGGSVTVINQPAGLSGKSGFDFNSIAPYIIPFLLIAGGLFVVSNLFSKKPANMSLV